MKRISTATMNKIMKIRYVFGATVIISLLLIPGFANYASANPGCAIIPVPNPIAKGSSTHITVTCPAFTHTLHSHRIAVHDANTLGNVATDTGCEAVASASPELETAPGNAGIPAGQRIHFTSSTAGGGMVQFDVYNGAGTTLFTANSQVAVYYGNAGIPTYVPPNAGTNTNLIARWNLAGADTVNPTSDAVWLCTFQDSDNTFGGPGGPINTNYPGDLGVDPDTTSDSFDLSLTTFTIATHIIAGGIIQPIDMTALFVAGIFTNAVWIMPTIGGVAGTVLALFKVKRKQS